MRVKKRIFSGAVCEQEVYTVSDRTANVAKAKYKPVLRTDEERERHNAIRRQKIMTDADRCICCGEIVPEGRQICPQCERKRYIYTIPDIPPSLNKFAGRENVWAYRADKKQWQALCAAYCRPKPSEPIKKCVVRITYFFRTRQRHDPDNYNGKFILDGLREAEIIEDDSFSNVELQLCGSYDKENPRTEIEVIL